MMDNNTPSINLHVSASSPDDLISKLKGIVTKAGGNMLSNLTDEDLLLELRDRCAKAGNVVKVVPFSDEKAEATPKRTRRNGNATLEPAAEQPKTTEAPAPEQAKVEQPKAAEAPAPEQAKVEQPKDAAEVTIDAVKAALNSYSAVHGQVKAREIMQKEGGAMRLMDILPARFAALVDALKVEPVKQAA